MYRFYGIKTHERINFQKGGGIDIYYYRFTNCVKYSKLKYIYC